MQREAKNAAEGGKTGSHDIHGDLAEHRPVAGRPDMRVFYGFDALPHFVRPTVTVGSYDGVHSGHLALLRTVAGRARAQGGESVVLTFEPHPRVTLGRADGLRLLTSLEEKIYLLGQQGIDNLIVIPFDKAFSALAPDTFIRDYLVGRIGAETLVVGFNHRFGRDKQGSYDYLGSHGFGLEVVEVGECDVDAEKVSSTVIRRLHSPADMEASFGRGEIDMALVFSERFSDKLYTGEARVQLVSDATDPNMATMQAGYAANIISSAGQEMLPPGVHAAAIVPQLKLLYNPQMKSAYNFVPGVMGLILMLICAMMTSISIVREKEKGTMEVLLVSPVKPLFIILAKAVPYFVLSFVNLTTILLLSVYVLNVPVAGSLFWLVVVSLLFIFVSLALGLLISTVTRTQVAAMLVSGLMLMMPTMLLSGMIFPIESMPVILQAISAVLPARWYIQAVRKLMIEGVDVSLVLMEVGILATMAVLLITVSFKKFKHRLE